MAKPRAKGKRFELEVARLLTLWWFPEMKSLAKLPPGNELPFRSTPLSGGWASSGDGKGDIVAPADFPFLIECKNQEAWSWEQLLGSGGKPMIDAYWRQTVAAAQRTQKIPLLLFTKAFRPAYVRCYPVTVKWLAHVGVPLKPVAVIHGQPYLMLDQLTSVPPHKIKGPVASDWLDRHTALHAKTLASTTR